MHLQLWFDARYRKGSYVKDFTAYSTSGLRLSSIAAFLSLGKYCSQSSERRPVRTMVRGLLVDFSTTSILLLGKVYSGDEVHAWGQCSQTEGERLFCQEK